MEADYQSGCFYLPLVGLIFSWIPGVRTSHASVDLLPDFDGVRVLLVLHLDSVAGDVNDLAAIEIVTGLQPPLADKGGARSGVVGQYRPQLVRAAGHVRRAATGVATASAPSGPTAAGQGLLAALELLFTPFR